MSIKVNECVSVLHIYFSYIVHDTIHPILASIVLSLIFEIKLTNYKCFTNGTIRNNKATLLGVWLYEGLSVNGK